MFKPSFTNLHSVTTSVSLFPASSFHDTEYEIASSTGSHVNVTFLSSGVCITSGVASLFGEVYPTSLYKYISEFPVVPEL